MSRGPNWAAERVKSRCARIPDEAVDEWRRIHARDPKGWFHPKVTTGVGDILRLHELGLVRSDGTWTCAGCARGVSAPPEGWTLAPAPLCASCVKGATP